LIIFSIKNMVIIIIILSISTLIFGYSTFNLLKKNEKQEDILTAYMSYMNKFSDIISFSDNKIKEIDARETFKSDDEIGYFFTQIKTIQDLLNQFDIKKI